MLPWHQRGPGSQRHRAARHKERQRHLLTKHPERRGPTTARETDAWVVLFSSHRTWLAAVRSYGRRWATEGSYRDAQGGWDGRHGWELEAALLPLTDPTRVERLVGLWALGALVQTWLGHCLGQPAVPTAVQAVRREWTTTGRLSVWARGRFALTEPSDALRPWVLDTLARGARHVAAGTSAPSPRPLLVQLALPEAA